MELFVLALTIAWICRDPAGTLKAAADYKKAQIARETARNSRVSRPGHRAFRRYLGTVWAAQWDEAAKRYPKKMKAAQARRKVRQDKRKAAWEKVQGKAGQRWDRRPDGDSGPEAVPAPGQTAEPASPEAADAPGTPGTEAAPETPDAPEGTPGAPASPEEAPGAGDGGMPAPVVDLAEERRRRMADRLADAEDTPAPDPTPEDAPAPEEPPAEASYQSPVDEPERTAPLSDADILRGLREPADDPVLTSTDTTTTTEEGTVPLVLSDAASLGAHLAALRAYADYWEETCTHKERLAAGMRAADMGEGTVAAVDASRSASMHAAAMARAAATALEDANAAVAEARAGTPDAADGAYYERR